MTMNTILFGEAAAMQMLPSSDICGTWLHAHFGKPLKVPNAVLAGWGLALERFEYNEELCLTERAQQSSIQS